MAIDGIWTEKEALLPLCLDRRISCRLPLWICPLVLLPENRPKNRPLSKRPSRRLRNRRKRNRRKIQSPRFQLCGLSNRFWRKTKKLSDKFLLMRPFMTIVDDCCCAYVPSSSWINCYAIYCITLQNERFASFWTPSSSASYAVEFLLYHYI